MQGETREKVGSKQDNVDGEKKNDSDLEWMNPSRV